MRFLRKDHDFGSGTIMVDRISGIGNLTLILMKRFTYKILMKRLYPDKNIYVRGSPSLNSGKKDDVGRLGGFINDVSDAKRMRPPSFLPSFSC
jgi:hypothetical protein